MIVRKKIIQDKEQIDKIIAATDVCYLSMISENKPYVVPMNFAYEKGSFFLHSGPGGTKTEALKKNPEVCISLHNKSKLHVRHDNVACSYSMTYESVVAEGSIVFIEDPDLKRKYLNKIMKHYTGKDDFTYNDPAINNVLVMKMDCKKICAHIRGF
jgi:uncharacterized protein